MKPFYVLLVLITLRYAAIINLLPWQQANGSPSNGSLALTIRTAQRVVKVGNDLQINCTLGGLSNHSPWYGAGDIQWYHNDELIDGVRNHTLDASTSQIVVEKSQPVDGGTYKCCLPLNCSEELKFLVGSLPQQAANLQCSSTNFKNITCTWTRGRQRSNLTTRDVLLQRSFIKSSWEVVCSAEKTTCNASFCSLSFDSVSCTMGTKYYKVQSTNELGSVNSTKISFHAGTQTIPNAPTNIKITNKSESSLYIEWDSPIQNIYRTQVSYCVEYRWEGINITDSETPKKRKITLGNLTHPYGLYDIRVGSRAEYALSSVCHKYSKWQSARTTEKKPSDPPGHFTCKASDPVMGKPYGLRNVTLSWKPPPSEYMQNGVIRGYDIKVRSLQHHHDLNNITVGPNETSLHITDLSVNKRYTFTILARNSMGNSPLARCDVPASTSPNTRDIWMINAPMLACVVVICMLSLAICCYSCLPQFRKQLPDLHVPRSFMTFNLSNVPHRASHREQEVFDELVTYPAGQRLVLDSSEDGHTGPISPDSHHERLLSTETCMTSIASVSTDILSDDICYSRMTKTGLSPFNMDERIEGASSPTREDDILMFSFEDNCVFLPKLCCPECDQVTGHPKLSAENDNCNDFGIGVASSAKPSSSSSDVPIMLTGVPLKFGEPDKTDGGVLDWLPESQEWASDFPSNIVNDDSAARNTAESSVDAIPSEYEKMSSIFKEQDFPLLTSTATITENISSPVATENYLNYVTVATASDDEDEGHESLSIISESPKLSASIVETENFAKDVSSGSEQPAHSQNGNNMQYIFVGHEERL